MHDYIKRMEKLDKEQARASKWTLLLEGVAFAGVVVLALVVALVFGA